MRCGRIQYSPAEMEWLTANRTMVISDYHRAFCVEFDRQDVTAAHLHALRKRKGWKIGRAPGRYAGRHWKFADFEIAWLRDNATMEIDNYHRAFSARFGRDDVTRPALNSMRKRMGWKTGRNGRFSKDAVPWSKGKKLGNNPGSARTQFRKGQQPHTWRGAGHESMDASGYIWLIVDETNPYTGAATRRVQKHRWLWEKENGAVPEGHVLKCIDSDTSNTAPANWEPVPLAMLPRLNGRFGRGYDKAPAWLKPVILATAKLEHQLRTMSGTKRNGARGA